RMVAQVAFWTMPYGNYLDNASLGAPRRILEFVVGQDPIPPISVEVSRVGMTMWIALDADGVFQVGAYLGTDIFDSRCTNPTLALEYFRELEARHLTAPGFARALSRQSAIWGCPGSTLLARHCEIHVDYELLDIVNAERPRLDGIALATNQTSERLEAMRACLQRDYFDVCVASCEAGVAKPSASYFDLLVDRLSARPDEVFFIDDRPENVAGARKAGLRASCFPRLAGASAMKQLLDSLF